MRYNNCIITPKVNFNSSPYSDYHGNYNTETVTLTLPEPKAFARPVVSFNVPELYISV